MGSGVVLASALHVLTLTPFFPSDKNEVTGCFVAEPIGEFGHLGVDSTVIAVSALHHPRRLSRAGAAAEWIRYPQVPGTIGLSSAGKLLYARLLGRVRRLHKAKPIAVIHAHAALPCGQAAMLLSRHLGIPFVVTVHGLDVFNNCHLGGIPAGWRREASVEVYRRARNVICISRKVEEILKSGTRGEVYTSIVRNGVDQNLFSPETAETSGVVYRESDQETDHHTGGPEILSVGMLLPTKGHELLLRVLAKLKASFPRLRCRIVGEGPDGARLEALVRDLELGQRVQFIPRLNRWEVAEAMRRCDVFALASRNEGLGCVYLEAMSCGKPAIGCWGQGIDEVIEHGKNGWLIPGDGVEELVQGLSTLMESVELRRRMGQAARQTILGGVTLKHQASQLAAIYRQAAAPIEIV